MGAAPPLSDVDERTTARRYAEQLLALHGIADARLDIVDRHPAVIAADCGLIDLSGAADAAPLLCPAPIAACADGAMAALIAMAPQGQWRDAPSGAQRLTERAALLGLQRRGAVSANGSCRLLATADGVIAINLARDDDHALLPAWLQADHVIADELPQLVATRAADDLVEQGRELGLAVARADRRPPALPWPSPMVPPLRLAARQAPRVVDLSSLWAGPLCSHLLQRCGADVIKVESTQRPDGARAGSPAFFEHLHAGKASLKLNFRNAEGRAALLALLQGADIVIEASRPRALRQLGIDADALIAADPGKTWISITGHGRREPQAQWIAYGDDAAVAAGLSHCLHQATGQWAFVGDAIADPLTGLHAAIAAWAGHQRGGGGLIDIAMVDVVRQCLDFGCGPATRASAQRLQQWQQVLREPRA